MSEQERKSWWRWWRHACVAASFLVVGIVALCGDNGRARDLVGVRNLRPLDCVDLREQKIVYVPIYPTLYSNPSVRRPIPMLVTLSLRNVSDSVPVIVSRVDVYDSDGRAIATYLHAPHELGPMQTADFVIDSPRGSGGSGANFVVTWGREREGPDLLVEAVMQARNPEAGISFTTGGHVVSHEQTPATIPTRCS